MKNMLALVLAFLTIAPLSAADWPDWRGPNRDGKLPDAEKFPVRWSASEGIRWRVPLPDRGNSSPIVVGDRIFLTQATEEGAKRSLLCFSTADGKQLWEKTIAYGKKDPTHKTNPYCAASPASDGETVVAWHGNAGLHAYDLEGKARWSRDLGTDYEHQWGPNAASPVLLGDRIFLHAGPGTAARIFCLDKASGRTIWEKELPDARSATFKEFKGSWATPLLLDNRGRAEMLLGLPGSLRSFDPGSGRELWRVGGLTDLCYTNPVAGGGIALYLCGYGGPGLGVKLPGPDETGDLTDSHRLWADEGKKGNRQRIGSGQLIGDHLYQLDEPGVMVCLEAKTGKKLWEERLSKKSWSSANLVGGRIYLNDQSATTFVIDPDPSGIKVLQTNAVDPGQHTNASLAFSGGVIYQRTDSFLYAIEGME